MHPATISLMTNIIIPADILFHELSGEAVLLNLDSGKYYGLDEIGTRIWMLLSQHHNLYSAFQILLDEYDVEENRLTGDLIKLVEDLVKNGLLQVEASTEAP